MNQKKWLLFSGMCLLQFADLMTTKFALHHGGIEANFLFSSWTDIIVAKIMLFFLFGFILYRSQKLWLVKVACFLYGAIVIWNLFIDGLSWFLLSNGVKILH